MAAHDDVPAARDPYAVELHALADRLEAERAGVADEAAAVAEAERMASAALKDLLADAFERGREHERRADVPAAVLRLEERDGVVFGPHDEVVPAARFSLTTPDGAVLETDFHVSVGDALADLGRQWDAREAEAHAL